jgi:hypothetical protein
VPFTAHGTTLHATLPAHPGTGVFPILLTPV